MTAKFIYATFESIVNFRNTDFLCGLDLQDTNLKEANFLNIKTNEKYTNRETYRKIKHSFDSIGNYIDGNKIYPCEMRKYQEELNTKPLNQEKIIFFINKYISDFGQSYIRPILWMILFTSIFLLLNYSYEDRWLYKICPDINILIAFVVDGFNSWAKAIIPFSRFLKPNMEFLSLIFFIIYSALIWQIVIAVKRHTRR